MKVLLNHLGLGDHLLCNGLVRELAKTEKFIVPCYHRNLPSVRFMLDDVVNVEVAPINGDLEMIHLADTFKPICLGYYCKDGFDAENFDVEFYRQAGVPFEKRWSEFHHGLISLHEKLPKGDYIFVHDDAERGFEITRLPKGVQVIRPDKNVKNIFEHIPLLIFAKEIHCINSSFLILIDSLTLPKRPLVFHHYARPTPYPKLKEKWEIL